MLVPLKGLTILRGSNGPNANHSRLVTHLKKTKVKHFGREGFFFFYAPTVLWLCQFDQSVTSFLSTSTAHCHQKQQSGWYIKDKNSQLPACRYFESETLSLQSVLWALLDVSRRTSLALAFGTVFFFFLLSDHNHQVDCFLGMVRAGYVCLAIIHRTLTWTTGFLTCAQMLMRAIAHGCVRTRVRESALKDDSGQKNPLPHRGFEPASAACRSDALPTELHPILLRGSDRESAPLRFQLSQV